LPLTTDCSGFVTLCYFLAGARDPNGLGYDGRGWTGTLLRHMAEVAEAGVGDVVVFGTYPGHHAAIVLEPGDDPLLASHGQERGPVEVRFSTESRYQPETVTWLTSPTYAASEPDERIGVMTAAFRQHPRAAIGVRVE
jgi:cell wall-associated NlpC family hydrolase